MVDLKSFFGLKGEKEPISIIILVFAHFIIGGGIAYIGQQTKNTREYHAGLLFILLALGLVAAQLIYTCSPECIAAKAMLSPTYVEVCSSCTGFQASVFLGLLSLFSWLYVIGRVVLIYKNKEVALKLI